MLKDFLSTIEVAKILNISRIAVFKKIKKGQLQAEKYGRNYLVNTDVLKQYILEEKIKKENEIVERENKVEKERKQIDIVVKKVVKEYGETLRLFIEN